MDGNQQSLSSSEVIKNGQMEDKEYRLVPRVYDVEELPLLDENNSNEIVISYIGIGVLLIILFGLVRKKGKNVWK